MLQRAMVRPCAARCVRSVSGRRRHSSTVWDDDSDRLASLERLAHRKGKRTKALLLAWGNNEYGQVGIPGQDVVKQPQVIEFSRPVTGFKKVCASWAYSFALTNGGELYSWGSTMGDGLLQQVQEAPYREPVPCQLPLGMNVVDIGVGRRHVVVLDDEGHVWTAGAQDTGQTGTASVGSTASTPLYRMGQHRFGDERIVSIVVGWDHNYACSENGHWYAWGGNYYGQCAFGHYQHVAMEPQRMHLVEQLNPKRVLAWAEGGAVVADDDRLWAWGNGSHGQVGGSGDGIYGEPKLMSTIDERLADVCFGPEHGVALGVSGRVWTWGNQFQGRLGRPLLDEHVYAKASPTQHRFLAGDASDMASTEEDPLLGPMPGANDSSGEEDGNDLGFTQHMEPPLVAQGAACVTHSIAQVPMKAIGAGFDFTTCVSKDGREVWGWGRGDSGRLGPLENDVQVLPQSLFRITDPKQSIASLVSGLYHTFAVVEEEY